MIRVALFAITAGALTAAPAVAQKRSPQEAAKAFSLDPATLSTDPTPAPAATPAPATADAAATPATPAASGDTASASPAISDAAAPADAPIVTTLGPAPSLDTPIEQLIANPQTRAVLDKDLPGLSTDENLIHFQAKSLRQFQPLTGGQLTTALLAKVGADLAALDMKAETTLAPAPAAPRSRSRHPAEGR